MNYSNNRSYPRGHRWRLSRSALFAALSLLAFACSTPAHAQQLQRPRNHIRPEVVSGQAPLVGAMPLDQHLSFSIVLPLRDQAGLDSLLTRLYDPSNPDFHHFLTVDQFTQRFGPTVQDDQAVIAFAQANGLTVAASPANRLVVHVSGTVRQIEQALNLRMNLYQHPTENRTFFSPDRDPSLSLSVPIAAITGLDNFSLPHPMVIPPAPGQPQIANVSGSGPGGSYLGSDMRAAYYGGTALDGNGQAVGLVEFDGYNLSDVNSTFSNASQTYNVAINNVLLDGATGAPTPGNANAEGEVVLDIAQAIGMAPGLSQVRVYIGNVDADILNSIASENIARQISCSWSWTPDDPTTDDIFFKEMAAQGQSFFTASGDEGAFDASISPYFYPQEDAYITAVGGTHLTTTGAGGAWSAETAWNAFPYGSGGGISPDDIAIAGWQSGVANSSNAGSSTLRNVPDVAMEGDFDNYACALGSCSGGWAGTSFAAPRWAGFMALVNEQAVEAGNAPLGGVGFLNPSLYTLAEGSPYANDLHDITSGNNDTDNQPVFWSAVSGYDLVTGWGSPAGQNLIDDLAGPQVPGFWIIGSPAIVGVNQGSSSSTTVSVSGAGGFTGNVTLAITSTLPSGVTASWGTNPTSGSSVLTLTASSSAPASTTPLTITGTSGDLQSTTTVTVAVHAPTFVLSASPNTLGINQSSTGTSTIAVTDEYGFSGSVNLSISGLPSGVTAAFAPTSTTGSSTLTLTASSSAAVGTSNLTITGTSGDLTQTTTLVFTVHGPSFQLSTSGFLDIGQGTTSNAYVYVYPLYGFTGNVNLSITGLPTGVTASFSPNPATSSSTLTITASSSAAVGTSTLTITGTSGALTATTTLSLGVYQPTFTVSSGGSLDIGQGSSGSSYVSVNPQYGFSGNVTFSVSGLPTGVTALWNPNPTTGYSTLTLAASSSAALGSSTLTIKGTSGAITATATLTLTVHAPTFTLYGGGNVNMGQGTTSSSYLYVTPQYGFTGSVTLSASGLPSGVTVAFSPNPTTGYTNLTFTATSTAALGAKTVTITGTSGSITVTTTLTLTVYAPTFTLSAYGPVSVGQGNSGTAYVYINSQYGFSGSVNFAVSGLPTGVTASFSPNPTTNTYTVLTLTAAGTAPVGQSTLTITGSSGSLTATTTLTLGVYAPTFTLSSYGGVSMGQGTTSTSYVSVNPQYGFSGSVTLSVSGLPSGVTAAFSPNPASSSSTLTLAATSTAPTGQYTLTITGTSGSVSATTTLTLGIYAQSFTLYAGGIDMGQGSSSSTYVGMTSLYGFTGSVNLSISGLPSGVTASFSPNPTTSSSTLTLTTSSAAAPGQYTLTVTGTSGTQTATTTVSLGIYAQSFTLGSSVYSMNLNEGSSGLDTVYVYPQYGFTGSVTFSASGLPSGVTAAFSPNPATGNSTLTITVGNNATPGTTTVTITGTSGTLTASNTFYLTINAPGFSILSAPGVINLIPGGSGESTVAILPQNGFAGSVTLAATGLPSGVTAAFSPNPTSAGASLLTLTASSTAAIGTATVTIAATAGSLTASTSVSVIVQAAPATTATTLEIAAAGAPVTSVAAGTVVTLTGAVKAGTTTLSTGQVNFCDTAATLCDRTHLLGSAQLTSAGTATLKFIPGMGVHSYKAVFVATNADATSSSAASSLSVTASQPTTTTLAQSGSPGNYTLTATVTGQGAVAPSGTVSFLDTTSGNAALGSAALGASQTSIAWGNPQSPTVGNDPASIAIGDFNGDGIPDLAIVNATTDTVTILLGKGDGTFTTAASSPATGSDPSSIAIGDFNRDGNVDLAVANLSSNTLTILLGNGDGTFTASPSIPGTGNEPEALAVGDFNGDGFQDLAILDAGTSTVTVQLGNGDGTFTPSPLSAQTGNQPRSLVVGDFNGDGILDLATVNTGTQTVTVLLGNGDGSFTAAPSPATGSYPYALAAADFNHDGKLDLAVANQNTNTVTILLGNGDGTFTPTTTSPTGINYPIAIAAADFNGDGKTDLVEVANNYLLGILPGNGDGTFGTVTTLSAPPYADAVAVGDLDGNGTQDLAIPSSYEQTVSIFTSQLTQTTTATVTGISPAGTGTHNVEASYAGDTTYQSSVSATTGLTAQLVTPTVTVTPSASSITTAQALTVTVTVAGSSGDPTPTGSVILTSGSYSSAAATLANGGAAINIPAGSLAAGNDTLAVTYTPDTAGAATFNSATGTAPVTVTTPAKITPTVAVTPSASSITTAQALTVTVAVAGGTGNPTPSGSVILTSGGYTSAAATLSSGAATINIPAGSLATGADALTVAYTPDTASSSTYNSATGTNSVTVTTPPKTTPTVTVTPSASSITTAQPLIVTVAVAGGTGNPTPTGSVILSSGGYTSAAATLSSGAATINIPAGSLVTGVDTLAVAYTPDTASSSTYNSATGTNSVTVTTPPKTTPTVSVTPSASSITTAQALTVTVAVAGGTGNPTPTGSVTLTSGGYTSAAATLAAGSATVNIPAGALATGTDTLAAAYTPDTASSSTYNSATGTNTVTVTTPPKTTPIVTVSPSASSITTTQPLTVTITVAGGTGNPTPTGSVILTSGAYTSAAAALSSGLAVISVPAGSLPAGSDTLTAAYTPDSASSTNYNSATGSNSIAVAKVTPTLTITPSASSITTAQALSVTIAVAAGTGNPTPTGFVTLTSGTYSSAATTFSAGGATINVPAGSLATGADTLTATYTPDSASSTSYNSATGTNSVTVTPAIGATTPTITATPSAATITDLQNVTVTVTVAGPAGQPTPTGSIVLSTGSYTAAAATLSSGSAAIDIPAGTLASGANILTVAYSGDPTYTDASATTTVTVAPLFMAIPTLASVVPGSTATGNVTITAGSSYSGTLSLTCTLTASPSGAQSLPACGLTPTSLTLASGGTGTGALSITTTAASTASLAPPPQIQRWKLGGAGSLLAAVLFFGIPARRRRWASMLVLLFFVAIAGSIGCGGGSGSTNSQPPPQPTPATTAGNYTFTVKATDAAANVSTSATVTLTVQ